MYAGYLDESFDDGNKGIFAVAGLMADGWQWLDAETRWQALLGKYKIKVFKARRLRNRKPGVYSEFAQVLIDARLVGWGTVVMQDEFFKTFAGSATHRIFKRSPYFLAYQEVFVRAGLGLKCRRAAHAIAFVCDKTDVYAPKAQEAYAEMKLLNPVSAPYLGSLTMMDDEKCNHLQMADLLATELRIEGRFAVGLEAEHSSVFEKLRGAVMWKASHYDACALREILRLAKSRDQAPS